MFDGRPIVNCVEREKVGNNTTLQAAPDPSDPAAVTLYSTSLCYTTICH